MFGLREVIGSRLGLTSRYKAVSFANSTLHGRRFMYARKRIVPMSDPCGKPGYNVTCTPRVQKFICHVKCSSVIPHDTVYIHDILETCVKLGYELLTNKMIFLIYMCT